MEGIPTPSTPAAAAAGANAALDVLDEVLWAARPDGEVVAVVAECERLRAHLAAIEAAALAEVEDRRIAKRSLAWSSTGDWFTHVAGTHRSTGRRTVRQAKLLAGERSVTREAMRDGLVSPEQAAVIVDAVEALPLDTALRERAEKVLLHQAGELDASELAKAARHLVHVADPEGAERKAEKELKAQERAAHLGRFLAIVEDGAGGVRLRGRGTVEDAAHLKAALLPLTKPAPRSDGDHEVEEDPRDHGARMWDALIETAQHALATDLPPEAHGARPRLTVTISLDALQGSLAAALACPPVSDDGAELSPGAIRRLACDAEVIPIVLGSRSDVLDVGRLQRLVTPAIWRALVARDRHCAFPGCTKPPVMGHAHHIVHWADLGPTALHNLVLLCGHHHRTIHHTPWQVRLNPADGRPEFLPPPRPGHHQPPPGWIRQRPRLE